MGIVTVNLADLLSAWWFVLSLPVLFLLDLTLGVVAQRTTNRRVLLTWAVGVASVVILLVLVCGVSLRLPQAAAIQQMSTVPLSP